MNRITNADLQNVLKRLSDATNRPAPNQYGVTGSLHIAGAYGGNRLEEYDGPHGGTRTISHGGFDTKRRLYSEMDAMLSGVYMAKETK